MILVDILDRSIPLPWSEGETIPWNEPGFSERMLKEHLSQSHDAASRRYETIDRHIQFLFARGLAGQSGRVLDLGCGPGLYLERLARLGCTGTGIDFSPASIAYARQIAGEYHLPLAYILGDIRGVDFGGPYDLVCLLFGEMNVFRPLHMQAVLRRAWDALAPGGTLVLEPSTEEHIRALGASAPAWYSQHAGLFSERPHLVLEESFWNEQERVATNRYYVVDAATAAVERFASSYQAYSDDELRALLVDTGFHDPQIYPNLTGAGDRNAHVALVGHKDAAARNTGGQSPSMTHRSGM